MRISILLASLCLAGFAAAATDYLVAVPSATASDPEWSKVADALASKYNGKRVEWSGKPDELLPLLKENQPRWLAVVGKPDGFDAAFVRAMNRISRQVDDDPWADVRWGLITGAKPADAQRIVDTKDPLIIERGLSTTGIDFSLLKSGLTLSDGAPGDWTEKLADGTANKGKWDEKEDPAGTVNRFAKAWNEGKPQLLVTSSHATQFNLEMPFSLGLIASHGGKFNILTKGQLPQFARFLGGAMFRGDVAALGSWLDQTKPPALDDQPDVPKAWLACGNCLIADARKTGESMVVTAMSGAGVRQFVGYVVPSWFGRSGWGTLALWQSNRGLLSLSDAFFLNQNKIIDETLTRFPKAMGVNFDADDIEHMDRKCGEALQALQKEGVKIEKDFVGLIHDRDVTVLWGDPKWEATFHPEKPAPWQVKWGTGKKGATTLTVTANEDHEGELALFLPNRMTKPQFSGATPAETVLADDFVLFRKLKVEAGKSQTFEIVSGA